jgi:site-specific DNA-methyltransferase (adenine-specific)
MDKTLGVLQPIAVISSQRVLILSTSLLHRQRNPKIYKDCGLNSIMVQPETIVVDDAMNIDHHLGANEVDLTVTSPPYFDAVDYKNHLEGGNWSGDQNITNNGLEAYLNDQMRIFEKLLDLTKDGGYLCIIIGTVNSEDRMIPLPHHLAVTLDRLDWNFAERIIWHKVTGGSQRFGVTIQHPHPTYYYPNQMHEEILIFRKGLRLNKKDSTETLEICEYVKKEVANDVWHIAPVPPNQENHPCPFPEEIPHRLIKLYCPENGVVCDPMCGSGTVPKVANALNRGYVASDIEESYVKTAKQRVTETYNRREQLLPNYEKTKALGP